MQDFFGLFLSLTILLIDRNYTNYHTIFVNISSDINITFRIKVLKYILIDRHDDRLQHGNYPFYKIVTIVVLNIQSIYMRKWIRIIRTIPSNLSMIR